MTVQKILALAFGLAAGTAPAIAAIDNTPLDPAEYPEPIRVACVGDSITAGGYPTGGYDFPTQVGKMLGPEWMVMNFGRSGATATKGVGAAYHLYQQFADAIDSDPDVVVIQLGTNDANPNNNWPVAQIAFKEDLRWLIRRFEALPSQPRVFVCRPTYSTSTGFPEANLEPIREWVEELAAEEGTGLIDNEIVTKGFNDYNANDGVHPNPRGHGRIAENIFHVLTGEDFPANVIVRPGVGQVAFSWHIHQASQPYSVSRSVNGGAPAVIAPAITNGTFTDTTITVGNTYSYTFATTNVYGTTSANPVGNPATSPAIALPVTSNTGWADRTAGVTTAPATAADGLESTDWSSGSTGQTAVIDYDHGIYLNWATGSYVLTSSSQAAAKDPAAWQVLGSNDGVGWAVLDTRAAQTFTTRGQSMRFTFSNFTPYRFHRLSVTATAGGNSGVALAEWRLSSADSLPVTAANVEPAGSPAANAFDGLDSTKWYNGITNGTGTTGWLRYGSGGGGARALSSYRITSASDVAQRDPKDWQFQGSNNGTDWTTLDTRSAQVFANRLQTSVYQIASAPWRHYRLNVTANAGGASFGLQLAEVKPVAAAAPPASPPPPVLSFINGQTSLAWISSAGADSYTVKRAIAPGGPFVTLAGGLAAITFTDTTANAGAAYYYQLVATGLGGESISTTATTAALTAPPAPPSGLSSSGQNLAVNLVWSASPGATGYSIKRSRWNGGPYTTVATGITSTSHLDTGLVNGSPYYYVVSSNGPGGESGNSMQSIGSPQVVTSLPARPFVHPLFGSHVVLQRGAAVPVWGWAAPGTPVAVAINGQTKNIVTPVTGRWQVEVGPFAAGGPYVLSITGPQTVTANDVYFGDVFILSGQSNIERKLFPASPQPGILNYEAEVAGANFPLIRHFSLTRTQSSAPQPIVNPVWKVCSPTAIVDFSAVGYFMARHLYQTTGVPIGLLHTTYGGSAIEPWLDPESAAAFPDFRAAVHSLPSQTAPGAGVPSAIFNSMIAPLAPFRTKAALWYQGESSAGAPDRYSAVLPALMKGWRRIFAQPDLPFLIIQLPDYSAAVASPVQTGSWAELREAQKTAAENDPRARLVTTIDVGDSDIHPPNKQDVGLRAAYAALDVAYGQTLVSQGPLFTGAVVQGSSIRCSFSNTGAGLMVGSKTDLVPTTEVSGGTLTGFAIAGTDKVWVTADAVIDGHTVVVSSASVAAPLFVRYGWANMPACNLYNKIINGGGGVIDGLPASPFRNDPIARLNVVNGTGSNAYTPGTATGIAANVQTGGGFAFWSGDVSTLASPGTHTTTATLHRGYTNVGATYELVGAPAGLAATPGSLSIALNWTALNLAASYNVKRSATVGGPFTVVAENLIGTTWTDNTSGFESPWFYRISASNPAGESPDSIATVTATGQAPGAPTSFIATPGNGVANLSWNAVSNVSRYRLFRATTAGGPYQTVVSSTPGTAYVDQGLVNGSTYHYILRALFGSDVGPASLEVSVIPDASTSLIRRSIGGTSLASAVTSSQTDVQAFDQSTGTKWYTTALPDAFTPGWLQYQFANTSAWAVTRYEITSANDVQQRDPKDWQLLASNDGSIWTVIDTRSGEIFASRLLKKTYNFANTTPYRSYRLNVTANSGGSGFGLQLAEFALFSPAGDQGDKTPPVFGPTPNLTASGASGASVNFSIGANDAVSGALQATTDPASGSLFPVGSTVVNCSATDFAGNSASATFTVTVINTGDPAFTTPPSIAMSSGLAEISIGTVASRTYQLQRSYLLKAWENIGPAQPGGGTLVFSDTPAPPDGKAFYRIFVSN